MASRTLRFTDGTDNPFDGVKVYYADNSVERISTSLLNVEWILIPDTGVQAVNLYCQRTYPKMDRQTRETVQYPYVLCLTGKDFYYWSPTHGFGGADRVNQIPADGITKRGSLLTNGAFLEIYNRVHHDRFF